MFLFAENIVKYIEKTLINMVLTAFWYYNYAMAHVELLYPIKKPRSEPDLATWNCVCTMENNKLLEHYSYNESINVVEGALCIRREDKRHLCISEYNTNANVEGTSNNTRFLNVQYVHPAMKSPIKIKLDVSYLRNGNELFSRLHVFRLLNHQYSADDYIFDDNYEIHLMDHSVNKVIIKNNQYMKLDDLCHKRGYTINIHETR